jgi:hypothetical protein
MTCVETRAWLKWLMRELRAELGIVFRPRRPGRPRVLGSWREAAIRRTLRTVQLGYLGLTVRRLAAEYHVSVATITRIYYAQRVP